MPICSAYSRRRRAPTAWNVPAQEIAFVIAAAALTHDVRHNALDPSLHLRSSTARECQQHDATRISTIDDKMRDPMRKSIGLA